MASVALSSAVAQPMDEAVIATWVSLVVGLLRRPIAGLFGTARPALHCSRQADQVGEAGRTASGNVDRVGRALWRRRVPFEVVRLERGAALRGDSQRNPRSSRQRGPKTDRRARLYIPPLHHQAKGSWFSIHPNFQTDGQPRDGRRDRALRRM